MGVKSEMGQYTYVYLLIAVCLLLLNLYYFMHPVLSGLGLTASSLDVIVFTLRKGGLFHHYWLSKIYVFLMVFISFVFWKGMTDDRDPKVLWPVLGAGTVLFFLPCWYAWLYLLTTVAGIAMVAWSLAHLMSMRKPESFTDDPNESFAQNEKLITTDCSVNIPFRYRYHGEQRMGWVNIVNPFRGTMILGNPGSGKSYSVYGPFIEQMIAKGFSMFVYDFKYPSLSRQVYNELLQNSKGYSRPPQFCVINFNDPVYSMRCNPLRREYIRDQVDASEIAELVLKNAMSDEDKSSTDFFMQSAVIFLSCVIWYLREYEGGRYCTFPHVIEFITQDYKEIIRIMEKREDLAARIRPFSNAMDGNANDQLQGQLASAQLPLLKFVSKSLYWTLTGDDFPLDINNPEHPMVLCVGNDPDRQSIYGTTIALITTRMFKAVNRPGMNKCGILVDEMPTIYLKGLDTLIATGRSNKVAVVLASQDKSQISKLYGDKESEVIFNTVGNVFSGQVVGKTSESFNRTFGKVVRERDSVTVGTDSDSVSTAGHETELMPIRKIETLSQGFFIGKMADENDKIIDRKLFCGELIRDSKEIAKKEAKWVDIPRMTDFGEDDLEEDMRRDSTPWILKGMKRRTLRKGFCYGEEEMDAKVQEMFGAADRREKDEVLEEEIGYQKRLLVETCLDRNFHLVQKDVQNIIAKEGGRSQAITAQPDPRVTDALHGV